MCADLRPQSFPLRSEAASAGVTLSPPSWDRVWEAKLPSCSGARTFPGLLCTSAAPKPVASLSGQRPLSPALGPGH